MNRTQSERLLSHLRKGGTVTPMLALKRWGCFRLAARIRDLRDDGIVIRSRLVSRGGKRFAVYWL